MKCIEIQKVLDDYLDDAVTADEQAAIEKHVDHCETCQQLVDETNAIRRALRSLPVADASPGFEEKLFSAVRDHYSHDHYSGGTEEFRTGKSGSGKSATKNSGNKFFTGFATAIAASLALWFASTIYTPQVDETSHRVINLAMSQAQVVRLVFDAPTDLSDVTLSVVLPENVELDGFTGQRQLVWQTTLTKGENILALPVTAIRYGQGELVARLNYGDKTKQFHIVVKTTSDGAFIYQINQLKSA